MVTITDIDKKDGHHAIWITATAINRLQHYLVRAVISGSGYVSVFSVKSLSSGYEMRQSSPARKEIEKVLTTALKTA